MILRAYTVFDRKSLVYAPPFYSQTDSSAVRALGDGVADAKSAIGAHPNDYVLFHIGSYNDQDGRLEAVSPLVHIIDAIALVRPAPTELFGRPIPNGSDDHFIKEA